MDVNLSKLQETWKTEGPGRLQPMGLQKSEATQQLNSRCHVELLQMQEGDDSKSRGAPRRTLEGHAGSQGASTSPSLGRARHQWLLYSSHHNYASAMFLYVFKVIRPTF